MVSTTERQSNIELLRIVAMFMIILHHYCLFGGFFEQFDFTHITANTLLVQFFSLGGKIGVNIFFLITGYFMIDKVMKPYKVWKLIYQIFTINIIVCVFLLCMGENYSKREFFAVIPLLSDVPISFIVNYVVIYLLSPVVNKCLHAISRREFKYMLIVLLVYYCILDSFLFQKTFQYAAWAFVMYSIGAYIRLYGIGEKLNWHFGWITIGIIVLCWISMVGADYYSLLRGKTSSSLWQNIFTDANKITVLSAAISLFLCFLKLNIKSSKLINYIGGGTMLGVLLLHDNGWPMRRWLWTEFLHTDEYFISDYLWLHMLISVICIFIICIVLEKLRSYLLDRPFDILYKKHFQKQ